MVAIEAPNAVDAGGIGEDEGGGKTRRADPADLKGEQVRFPLAALDDTPNRRLPTSRWRTRRLSDVARLQWGLVALNLATDIFRLSLAWWVLQSFDRVEPFGALLFAMYSCQTIATLGIGAVGDALSPLWILRRTVALQASIVAIISILLFLADVGFGVIVVLSLVLSIVMGCNDPLVSASLATVAPIGKVTEVVGQRAAFGSASKVAAPVLAGATLGAMGLTGTLAISALFALASSLLLMTVHRGTAPPNRSEGVGESIRNWAISTRAGIATFARVRLDLHLCLLVCCINIALPSFFLIVVPYVVIHIHNMPPYLVGVYDFSFCAGMLVGGLRTVAILNRMIGKHNAVFVSVAMLAIMMWAFAAWESTLAQGVVLFGGGLFMMTVYANLIGLRSIATPPEFRTRIFSASTFLISATIPVGLGITTILLPNAGLTLTLTLMGLVCIAAGSCIYVIPHARTVLLMTEEEAQGVYRRLFPTAFTEAQRPHTSALAEDPNERWQS